MNHHQANELLPCLHCGSTEIREGSNGDEFMFAECQKCGATGPTALTRAEAFAAWNRRAPAPTSEPGARDAVLEEVELPPLPEHIEVGGEGWGWEDFCSEKTFSIEHMEDFGRACIAHERKRLAPAVPSPAPVAPTRMPIIGQGTPEEFAAAMSEWMRQDSPELRMFNLVCKLASLKSQTPEAVGLLVDEAQRIVAGKVEAQPAYPTGDVAGPCVCGSWPGGKCLKCEWIPAQGAAE